MTKLSIIKSKLIHYFPELEELTISFTYKTLEDSYMQVEKIEKNSWEIEVAHCLRLASIDVLMGVTGHEFAHILKEKRKSPQKLTEYNERYDSDDVYRRRVEKNTDRLTIQRGLGAQLLEFMNYANIRKDPVDMDYCLTENQIKVILKKQEQERKYIHYSLNPSDYFKSVA